MFLPADAMLYFYLLVGQRMMSDDNTTMKPYKPHTTSVVISNRDMYNLNEIIDMTFDNKEKK